MTCLLAHSLSQPMSDDPDVLLLAVRDERDRDAFLGLFEHFGPILKGWLCKGGMDAIAADELVQEILLRVWRRADRWDPTRGSATTWVFAIARNARIDRHRRVKSFTWDDEDPALVVDPDSGPMSRASKSQRAAAVREALEGLPDEQASVLRHAYFEQRTLREIAELQQVALGTIKSRVRLAMARLRLVLGEHR